MTVRHCRSYASGVPISADPRSSDTLGQTFARAVARKDHDAVRALLAPDFDFRAMTPSRVWEASTADDVVAALQQWFEDTDVIESVERLDGDSFADRERVGYRFRLSCPDGPYVVEQQAFLSEVGGRIGWLRIMCSGFRPVEGAQGKGASPTRPNFG